MNRRVLFILSITIVQFKNLEIGLCYFNKVKNVILVVLSVSKTTLCLGVKATISWHTTKLNLNFERILHKNIITSAMVKVEKKSNIHIIQGGGIGLN